MARLKSILFHLDIDNKLVQTIIVMYDTVMFFRDKKDNNHQTLSDNNVYNLWGWLWLSDYLTIYADSTNQSNKLYSCWSTKITC